MTSETDSLVARLHRLVWNQGFSFVAARADREGGPSLPSLLDEEGEVVYSLDEPMLAALSRMDDDAAQNVLFDLHRQIRYARDRAYRSGVRAGRAALVDTVHELLGVKIFSEALARVEATVSEGRGHR